MKKIFYLTFFTLIFPLPGLSKGKSFLKQGLHKKSRAKSRSAFEIKFSSRHNSDGNLEIQARVNSRSVKSLSQFNWKLPKHWKLVEGDSSGNLDFSKDPNATLKITVSGENMAEKDQAFLMVYHMQNGERHGLSASYIHKKEEVQVSSSSVKRKVRTKKKFFE